MFSDFGVVDHSGGITSIGSGYCYALGSLHTSANGGFTPKERILLALEATAEFCPTVREPFRVFMNTKEVL